MRLFQLDASTGDIRLPNRIEGAFLSYLQHLDDSLLEVKRLLEHFTIANNGVTALSPKQGDAPKPFESTPFTRFAMSRQMIATAIIIPLSGFVEDLFHSTGLKGYAAGPEINGVPFTLLLKACAASIRHHQEWSRIWTEAFTAAVMSNNNISDPLYTPRQLFSINPLQRALNNYYGSPGPGHVAQVLMLVSDSGYFNVFRDRLYGVAYAIGQHSDRHKTALKTVLEHRKALYDIESPSQGTEDG